MEQWNEWLNSQFAPVANIFNVKRLKANDAFYAINGQNIALITHVYVQYNYMLYIKRPACVCVLFLIPD